MDIPTIMSTKDIKAGAKNLGISTMNFSVKYRVMPNDPLAMIETREDAEGAFETDFWRNNIQVEIFEQISHIWKKFSLQEIESAQSTESAIKAHQGIPADAELEKLACEKIISVSNTSCDIIDACRHFENRMEYSDNNINFAIRDFAYYSLKEKLVMMITSVEIAKTTFLLATSGGNALYVNDRGKLDTSDKSEFVYLIIATWLNLAESEEDLLISINHDEPRFIGLMCNYYMLSEVTRYKVASIMRSAAQKTNNCRKLSNLINSKIASLASPQQLTDIEKKIETLIKKKTQMANTYKKAKAVLTLIEWLSYQKVNISKDTLARCFYKARRFAKSVEDHYFLYSEYEDLCNLAFHSKYFVVLYLAIDRAKTAKEADDLMDMCPPDSETEKAAAAKVVSFFQK